MLARNGILEIVGKVVRIEGIINVTVRIIVQARIILSVKKMGSSPKQLIASECLT